MDSLYEPDTIPPNLNNYLGPDGNLHMSIPRDSVLYKLTHHPTGRIKQHLLMAIPPDETDEKKPNVNTFISMYDTLGSQLVDDFLDESSTFIPFSYKD